MQAQVGPIPTDTKILDQNAIISQKGAFLCFVFLTNIQPIHEDLLLIGQTKGFDNERWDRQWGLVGVLVPPVSKMS